MKIVQINTVCGAGSVGRIAAELYHITESHGHQSFFAYGRGNAPHDIKGFKIGNPFDFACHVLSNFFLGNSGFASRSATVRFLAWLDKVKPDILHLHNIHGFYLHVGILFDYIKSRQLPVVWTLHDCWPFTGQCAYFDYEGCEKWKTHCHNCPLYRKDYPYSLFKDNSIQNYELKKEAFTGAEKMHIITPSRWLHNLLKESYLNGYPASVIQNGIDLEIFKPRPDFQAPSKHILGAANIWSARKGLPYFLQLAEKLDPSYKITLVGLSKKQKATIDRTYGSRITTYTRTQNIQELADLYNLASVFVNPTLEDNFPTTNLEALACGTPVITFNTGGSPESLTEQCGIVVEKGSFSDLLNAVYMVENSNVISRASCRRQSLLFDRKNKFQEYFPIYYQLTH